MLDQAVPQRDEAGSAVYPFKGTLVSYFQMEDAGGSARVYSCVDAGARARTCVLSRVCRCACTHVWAWILARAYLRRLEQRWSQ